MRDYSSSKDRPRVTGRYQIDNDTYCAFFTKGDWFVELTDLTIRSKAYGDSDQMGDYKGCIVADLRPALGVDTDRDVDYQHCGRGHALPETLANATLIASAPEMFEAIMSIHKACRRFNQLLSKQSLGKQSANIGVKSEQVSDYTIVNELDGLLDEAGALAEKALDKSMRKNLLGGD